MNTIVSFPLAYRKSCAASPIAAERARIRALPAVRLLTGRFALPIATAMATAEAIGLNTGADR